MLLFRKHTEQLAVPFAVSKAIKTTISWSICQKTQKYLTKSFCKSFFVIFRLEILHIYHRTHFCYLFYPRTYQSCFYTVIDTLISEISPEWNVMQMLFSRLVQRKRMLEGWRSRKILFQSKTTHGPNPLMSLLVFKVINIFTSRDYTYWSTNLCGINRYHGNVNCLKLNYC